MLVSLGRTFFCAVEGSGAALRFDLLTAAAVCCGREESPLAERVETIVILNSSPGRGMN